MREQKDRIPIADTDQIGLRDRSVQSDEMNRRPQRDAVMHAV
jgi:hypothetical protein